PDREHRQLHGEGETERFEVVVPVGAQQVQHHADQQDRGEGADEAAMITTPVAVPSRCRARSVRGKSKPMLLPGPPIEKPETSTISNHIGAGPGHSTSASSGTPITATMSSTSVERRS